MKDEMEDISTHSLSRRLTRRKRKRLPQLKFQLTASQGGWLALYEHILNSLSFQLTASQGGWPGLICTYFEFLLFQLTASQGGWRILSKSIFLIPVISTHSLSRRLTFDEEFPHYHLLHFNSQPLKEADFKHLLSRKSKTYFNSQPLKEADPLHQVGNGHLRISTHSLSRRLTLA